MDEKNKLLINKTLDNLDNCTTLVAIIYGEKYFKKVKNVNEIVKKN